MHDSDTSSTPSSPSTFPFPSYTPRDAQTGPILNDHVLQAQSPTRTSSSEALPTHPFDLNFPTLNDDGSVPDLTAHQFRRHHSPTPPAALSSLGARLKMDASHKRYDSESEGSLTDNQYDMLDDLSEVSDGHDTASIASVGEDGQRTPYDSQSEAGAEDSTLLVHEDTHGASASAFQSFIDVDSDTEPATRAEDSITESYWRDDLETPRQSTITSLMSAPYSDDASPSASRVTRHILLFSEKNDSQRRVMDNICAKVACCMDDALDDLNTYKVIRLPATPSGINLPSATVVHGQGSVTAAVQHCIGVDSRNVTSYKLRILDHDGEHSSFFTVGEDAKIQLQQPDIAIFYITRDQEHPVWLKAAQKAVKALNAPVLFVFDSENVSMRSRWMRRHVLQSKTMKTFSVTDVCDMSVDTADDIMEIINAKSTKPTNASTSQIIYQKFSSRKLLPLLLGLLMIAVQMWASMQSKTNPALETTARREGLVSALHRMTNSTEVVQLFDVERLLPNSTTRCSSGSLCSSEIQHQVVWPNHFVVSLPKRHHLPQLSSVRVYKADGKHLPSNQTTLIEGVYMITFDVNEAHGEVFADVQTKQPVHNITITQDFGNRMLQFRTYEKASTDVSKEVSKDVALMRQKARDLSGKLPATIGASVWATKNVTSQIVLYVARDLQVMSSTALSIFSKAANVSSGTASSLGKDLLLMRSDLAEFTREVSTKIKSRVESTKEYSKALIRQPIERSRQRVQGISKALGFAKAAHKQESQQSRLHGKAAKNGLAVMPDSDRTIQSDWEQTKRQVEELRKQTRAAEEPAAVKKCAKKEARKQKKEARKQEKAAKRMKAG